MNVDLSRDQIEALEWAARRLKLEELDPKDADDLRGAAEALTRAREPVSQQFDRIEGLSASELELLVGAMFTLDTRLGEIGNLAGDVLVGDIGVLVMQKQDAVRRLRDRLMRATREVRG